MGALGILALAGVGLSSFGQYSAGQAQRKAGEYNSRVLRQKAKLTEMAMESETKRGREQARRIKASQLAGFAKSGAQIGTGTPLLVMAEQAGEMEMDILNQRRNRMIEARDLRTQAQLLKIQGKQAGYAGNLAVVGSLLGGGAKVGMAGGG